MNEKKITSLGDPAEVPENMTEEEEREFWDTHGVTEEFLDKAGPVLEGMLPPARPRTRPIAVRFDDDTLGRLRFLAKKSTKATRRCSRSSSPSASTKKRSAKALFKRGDPAVLAERHLRAKGVGCEEHERERRAGGGIVRTVEDYLF